MGKKYSHTLLVKMQIEIITLKKFSVYIKIYKAIYLYTHPHPIISNSTPSGTQQKYIHMYNKNRFEIFTVATLFIVTIIRNNPNDQQLVEWINCYVHYSRMIHSTENESNKSIWSKSNKEEKASIHKRICTAWVCFIFSFSNIFLKASKTRGLEVKIVVSSVGEEAVFERERKEALRC